MKNITLKKKRDSFPDTGYNSIKREKNYIPPKEVKALEYDIDDVNQRELAERRRNFAITRSRSFALPVGLHQSHILPNPSLSSLSRKSSFSSLLSKNDSLGDRTLRKGKLHPGCGWNDKNQLFLVIDSSFSFIIYNAFNFYRTFLWMLRTNGIQLMTKCGQR